MGDPNVFTPNLDTLSEEGVTFTRAVAGCPWCTPFRASLLTSRYVHNTCPTTPSPLDPELPTVAEPFNRAGYDTAYFGKWHLEGPLGGEPANTHVVPRERRGGFRTWIGYENNNNPQYTCVHGHREETEYDPYLMKGFETDELSKMLIEHIHRRSDDGQPFFAVLSVQPPHCPYYTAPPEFGRHHNAGSIQLRPNVPDIPRVQQAARHDLAGYYALIENLDWNIGRIKQALKDTGLIDNTHVLFFSDHGDMHGSHGRWQKSTPWEESIRIPFIMSGMRPHTRHAGMFRPGAPVNHVDIAPTSLGLCGIDVPDWMLGYDYSDYRSPDVPKSDLPRESEPDSAYLQHCVRKMHPGCMDRTWRGIVTRDGWKYVVSDGFPYLMYDLNEDPYEQNNLALDAGYATQRERLQQRLARWMDELNDPYPLPKL
jgi:arylsulfatase A-like enzyme